MYYPLSELQACLQDPNAIMSIPGLDSDVPLSCIGPWTVLERRGEAPDVNFNLPWRDYKYGFGDTNSDFWLGLHPMFFITKVQSFLLRVDVWTFDGFFLSAEFDGFMVSDASKSYTLALGSFTGGSSNASAMVNLYNNRPFTTYDKYSGAGVVHGGWWFTDDISETFGWLTGPVSNTVNGSQWYDRKGRRTVPVKKVLLRTLHSDQDTGVVPHKHLLIRYKKSHARHNPLVTIIWKTTDDYHNHMKIC